MIALLSDIHGNLPALEAVLADIDQQKNVEQIISMGDIAGYYPMINECIEQLRFRQVINIMGNHDYYLVNNVSCGRSASVDELIAHQAKVITQANLQWLSKSVDELIIEDCSVVHGGWRRSLEEYIYKLNPDYFAALPYKTFFAGHTHVQYLHHFDNGQVFCNPGSIGQPRDGNPQSAYALFDGKNIILRRVEYDIDQTQQQMQALGFDRRLFENLSHGSRIGGRIDKITLA